MYLLYRTEKDNITKLISCKKYVSHGSNVIITSCKVHYYNYKTNAFQTTNERIIKLPHVIDYVSKDVNH
jgi:hypothetical protein